MNNNLKKFIQTSKDIKLSETRKGLVREKIVEFVEMNPIRSRNPQPLRSPFYLSKFSVLNFSKAVSFALIVLVAGGSTISYASEDTLPGDLFYTVKVNFTEPIQTSLAWSSEAKLEVKTKQIEKRLTEAQILLKNNDTTPQKHAEVEARVEKKVLEISETINKLQEKGDMETVLNTTSKLEPVLKAHKEALQDVIQQEAQTNTESFSDSSLKELESTFMTLSAISEPETKQEDEKKGQRLSTSMTDTAPEKSKTEIADILLKKVEESLAKVEQQEVETLVKIEELTQNGSDKASQIITNKVSELSKEIESIQKTIQEKNLEEEQAINNLDDVETFLDSSISSLNESLKNDIREIMALEAEILLEESKQLYEAGLYKEALAKAQEALKLTESFEISQKITTLKEGVQTEQQVHTEKIEIPVEIIQTEEELIQIESQAIQALESLEHQIISQ